MKKVTLKNEFDESMIDLFDGDSVSELGEMHCVGFMLSIDEAESMWNEYIGTCICAGGPEIRRRSRVKPC